MNTNRFVPRELLTGLLFAVACCPPVRADWCHGGEVPSLEWLVDASNIVVAEVVKKPDDYDRYRVTDILKRSKQFTMTVGDVIEGEPLWRWTNGSWKQGEPIVVFFGDDTSLVHDVVHLTRPKKVWHEPEKIYVAVDKLGKRVPDRDDFMRRVRNRIESAGESDDGFLPVREGGFEYYPECTEIDNDSEFFSLHVPPDPCFRKMLEEAATQYAQHAHTGSCVWAQSALYEYYLDYTDEQKKAHRKRTIQAACEFARTLQVRDEKLFSVTNYCTYRGSHSWLGRVSPNGRYLALQTGDSVELQDLASGDALSTNDGSHIPDCQEENMVFSADNKHFAHVQADGDVTLVDLTRMEVAHTFEFGWQPHEKMRIWRFLFSPDGRYLVLLLNIIQGANGCALQIWDVDSGQTVFKPSDDWNTGFSFDGFRRDSTLVKVRVIDYNDRNEEEVTRVQVWDLQSGRLTDEPTAGEWLMHGAWKSSRIVLERDPGQASLRAESGDGRLQAEVVLGTPQRFVIREAKSQKVVRTVELDGMIPVRDVYFTNSSDAVILVIGQCNARMFRVDADKPWPTWFGS